MNATMKTDLQKRFDRVIRYIDDHADQPLPVEELASIAAYSPFHFHRQFTALFGIAVSQYIRLIRMRRAAHTLAFRKNTPVLQIALDAGYEGPEAFARAFRQIHDQSPTEFRAKPNWDDWQKPYAMLDQVRKSTMPTTQTADVTILDFPKTETACLDHVGPPERIGETIQSFIAWRKTHHLHPSKHATFNIIWCNPDDTPPEDFRMGLAVATNQKLTADDAATGLYSLTIPAGRCARLRHIGSDQMLGESALRLYRDWLPQSGETTRDFPLFFQRVAFYPDVAAHEAITDIFLPLV
ncbi:MAG: AraC family transcriptional regulator [Thalassospira sp.]|uniref:AraC family transcriptional regulator n=1 Tax=Thalassospira sp. TaxID=1912094 RepID=UPI003A8762A9